MISYDPALVITYQDTVAMSYPGRAISKNHVWRGGRRGAMEPEAKVWRDNLANSVTFLLLSVRSAGRPIPVVYVGIRAEYRAARDMCDTHNLIEIIADAVQEGSGINDQHFYVTTEPPRWRHGAAPTIWIDLTFVLTLQEDV